MNTETSQVSVQYLNANLIRQLDNGMSKEAAEGGHTFLRERIRQEAFVDHIQPPRVLQPDELDPDEATDQARRIEEKEPESTAYTTQFQGAAPREWVKTRRYSIYMDKKETQRNTKSVFELATYRTDLRDVLSKNGALDLAEQKDVQALRLYEAIVNGNAGVQSATAGFNSQAFTGLKRGLRLRARPIGKLLVHGAVIARAGDLPATAIGDKAEKHYDEGPEEDDSIFGLKYVTCDRLGFPADRMWLFAPAEFLGHHFELQGATLFIKKEADNVSWWAYLASGLGVGNGLSIQRHIFND